MAFSSRRLLYIQFSLLLLIQFSLARAEDAPVHPRIIDGTLVPESQFPTVGKIGSIGSPDFCTGTLFAPRFVLCACHCVNNQSPGSFSFGQNQGLFTLGGKTYHTQHVYVNPTYAGDNSQQQEGAIDLSIFELDTDVKGVTPSPLYRKTPTVGTLLTLAGYGELGTGAGGATSAVPPKGKIATGKTPIDVVTGTFIEWNFDNVPPPNQESNTAPGDSGGPQFITENGVMYVASVTSGGEKSNASFGDFSYNTRVDIATPWIDSITGGEPVAGDHAPVLSPIAASAFGFLPGTPVTFSATASDADNDTLQYHWIFGDGTEDLNGTPSESLTFISEGDYLVQLVVSDMKGGSAGQFISVGALASDTSIATLTMATVGKKSFSIDFSAKDAGANMDVTIQSPKLKFASRRAFEAVFPKSTITSLYIGNFYADSIFGLSAKNKNQAIKFDYQKGIVQFQTSKNATLKSALNFFGAADADENTTLTMTVSLQIESFFQNNTATIRLGGDTAFDYSAKKDVGGKGK